MATYTFGSQVNQASFSELDPVTVPTTTDGVSVLVAPRPAPGTLTLQVKDAATLVDLPSITVGENGYWSYTTEDMPIILVSGDAGSSWSPHYAREATDKAILAGVNVALAVESANQAVSAAQANDARLDTLEATVATLASSGGGAGPGGFTWENAPAGACFIVRKAGSTWPARLTDRQDVTGFFVGTAPFPPAVTSGTGGYYDGVDVILEIPA